jgi:hypothetical protein
MEMLITIGALLWRELESRAALGLISSNKLFRVQERWNVEGVWGIGEDAAEEKMLDQAKANIQLLG